jgi:hypothetical protein
MKSFSVLEGRVLQKRCEPAQTAGGNRAVGLGALLQVGRGRRASRSI